MSGRAEPPSLWSDLEAAAIDGMLCGDLQRAVPFLYGEGSDALFMLGTLIERGALRLHLTTDQRRALRLEPVALHVAVEELQAELRDGRPDTESAVASARRAFAGKADGGGISSATVWRAKAIWKALINPTLNNR